MKKIGKKANRVFHAAAVLPTAMLSIGLTAPGACSCSNRYF